MFERFKRKNPEQHETPNPQKLVEPLGAAAIVANAAELTPTVEQRPSSENIVKVDSIMHEASQRYTEFARAAEAKGLDRPTIKSAILAAIEAGELPGLVRGAASFRGTGQEVNILSGGPIPEKLVHISLDPTDSILKDGPGLSPTPNTREVDNSIQGVSIQVRPSFQTRRVEIPDTLAIEKFHLPQQNDGDLDPNYGSWEDVLGKLRAGLNDKPAASDAEPSQQ